MDQELALEIMLAGHNVLLTGAAGSGKTFVLNQFIKEAKRAKKHVAVTATTGLAATHLGGTTIHAWSGIGVRDELPTDFEDHLLRTRRDIIELTDVLIVDEISMMHDFRLDMVDKVARVVRQDQRPFGGIQVILCGDFFQLPPVNRDESRQGHFVVNSRSWDELDLVICYLGEQHRQDDEALLDILNAIRQGDVRRRHAETLLTRVQTEFDVDNVTELHTTNNDVDRINDAKLMALEGDPEVYQSETTGSENYVMSLRRSCLAQDRLVLKRGALVMAIKNSLERKYVNGSIGIVIGFDVLTNYPIVEFRNGKVVTMRPDTWELRDGDKKRAGLTQIPLRLAYAITVHKSQGMTLDAARIDLRRAFVEGMGYVALSRVRSLDGLSLIGINRMALRVSEEALKIDQMLRHKACEDHARFEHLRSNATKRARAAEKQATEKEKKASSWAERLAKMRETYPNAYRPWATKDDNELKLLFQNGAELTSLSKKFGRHERSIAMRLQKHFGEDAISYDAQ